MFRSKERKKIQTRPKRKKPSVFLKVAFYFLLMAFLAVTVYVLIFSHFLQVNYLNLSGTEELGYNDVYGTVKGEITGKYFDVIPKNNFIVASKKRISHKLLNDFKKIKTVEVEKVFPDTVNVKIIERQAHILWCTKGPCYMIDEDGYAYSGADFESAEIRENNLIRVTDISAKPIDIGEEILDADYVSFLSGVRETFKADLDIDIEDEYLTRFRISEEIQVKTSEGWSIYISSILPLKLSIRTLKTFMEKEISEEVRKELEYVDLRVENKVFYKVKKAEDSENNEDLPSEISEGESSEADISQGDKKDKKKDKN